MEIIYVIIIGVVLLIILIIYKKSQNNQIIKQQNIKEPEEKLDFLDKNYEATKIKEIQYLTSQNESTENDISSKDLF